MRINQDKFLRVPALESVMPRLGKNLVFCFWLFVSLFLKGRCIVRFSVGY